MPATLTAPPLPPTVTALIDADHDDLRPVNEIVKARLGKRVSPATLWRWIRKGTRGARLEVVYVAGCWCTTEGAFGEFLRQQTANALGDDAPPESPAPRTAEKTAKLRRAGLLK